jgi:antitoxin component YwqK of YwqJK toxin-antitoxin module
MNHFIPLLIYFFVFSLNGAEPFRTWTDLNGAKITAAFIREANGNVVIKRNDGKIYTVKKDIFGAADQKYLVEYKLRQNKEVATGLIEGQQLPGKKIALQQLPGKKIPLENQIKEITPIKRIPAGHQVVHAKVNEVKSTKVVWSTLYDNNNIKVEILSNGVQLKALQRRNVNGKSLSFLPNLETPYSGWAFKQWGNGQLQVAGRFENGMNQGVWMNWSIRGEKVYQVTYKNDIRHGDCIDIESGVAKKIIYVNGVKQ